MNQDALPWYRSPVMISQVVTAISALAAVAPKIATKIGLTSTDVISSDVTAIFGVIAILAPIYGAFKRAKSTVQPLTMTQAGADVHPNTIINNEKPLPTTKGIS